MGSSRCREPSRVRPAALGRNRLQPTGCAFALRRTSSSESAGVVQTSARGGEAQGALAMVVATQYPKPEAKEGRGQKSFVTKHFPMVTSDKLSMARTVIANAPELVD